MTVDEADAEAPPPKNAFRSKRWFSVATVRRMEGTELLPVVIDGKHCFPIEEVDRHRKVTGGDLAAAAFQIFNDDRTQVDVVIALKECAERIRGLHQCWVEMGQCIVASSPGRDIGFCRASYTAD
jgi:hypothetical protein